MKLKLKLKSLKILKFKNDVSFPNVMADECGKPGEYLMDQEGSVTGPLYQVAGTVKVTSPKGFEWGKNGNPTRAQFDEALLESLGEFATAHTLIIHTKPLEKKVTE